MKNISIIFHGFWSETKPKDIFYWRSEALVMSWFFSMENQQMNMD